MSTDIEVDAAVRHIHATEQYRAMITKGVAHALKWLDTTDTLLRETNQPQRTNSL